MRYGLLGEKLGHSFSKEIHEKLGLYSYELIELTPAGLDAFLREKDFSGVNVTIPYKQTVIPYLDGISDRAGRIGAVNTIVNRGGKLFGDNTDFGGLEALVRRTGLVLGGKTVLIAGTGGTSRTARAVAEAMGAAKVLRMSRSGKEDAVSYEEAYEKYASAQILFNTTPSGMYPKPDGMAVDLDRLPELEGVIDVVYNPLTTRLVREARERGIRAENGLYMLVAQAVLAAETFTGMQFGQDVTDGIFAGLVFEKRNIVLTGMPSSGKSTIGRILSEKLGRELVDTDEEIVKRAGMPIKEIFRTKAEKTFRDLETETIQEVSASGGKVLSTGGGAILRKRNVDLLKSNGTVVFLDRPLEALLPSDDRPLADDAEKLRRLYTERLPVYTASADVILQVGGTPEQTTEKLLEKLK
jgi:shikimate dehydrogenase